MNARPLRYFACDLPMCINGVTYQGRYAINVGPVQPYRSVQTVLAVQSFGKKLSSLLRLGCCQALSTELKRVLNGLGPLQKEEVVVRIKLGQAADRARNIDQATKVASLPLVILFQGWTGGS